MTTNPRKNRGSSKNSLIRFMRLFLLVQVFVQLLQYAPGTVSVLSRIANGWSHGHTSLLPILSNQDLDIIENEFINSDINPGIISFGLTFLGASETQTQDLVRQINTGQMINDRVMNNGENSKALLRRLPDSTDRRIDGRISSFNHIEDYSSTALIKRQYHNNIPRYHGLNNNFQVNVVTSTDDNNKKSKKAKTSESIDNAASTPVRGDDQSVDETTDMFQKSPMMNDQSSMDNPDLDSVIDKIYGGWGNMMVINRMKQLVKDDKAVDIRNHTKNYLLGLLQNVGDKEKLKQAFDNEQAALGDSINKLKKSKQIGYVGEKKTYTANFGEALDDATEGVVLANYAPIGDSKPQNKQILCRIPRDNICMSKFVKSLPNSLISELQRNQSGDEKMSSDSTIQRLVDGLPTLRLTDACSIVLGKDDYHGEVDQFVLDARYKDIHEFYMLSLITMGYHAALSKLNHRQNLPILITTANGRDNLLAYDTISFGNDGVFENDAVKLFRYVPHGECWGNKMYLLKFVKSRNDGKMSDEEEFDRFGQSLLGFYSCFSCLNELSHLNGKSRIAYRYSGLDFMTDEERRDLYLARLFFYKSKRLAILLFRGDPKRPRELTVLEGDDAVVCKQLLGDNPSENDKTEFYAKLKKVYYNTCWQSLSSAMFGNGPKKCFDDLEQEYKDVYSALKGTTSEEVFEAKLEGIYKGCAKGGSWGTLASAMFGGGKDNSYEDLDKSMKDLYDKLKGSTVKEVFEAKVRGVYDGRAKGGSWGTLASAMFGGGEEMSRKDLSDIMQKLYDELKGTTDEDVFVAKVRGVYEARVKGGTTSFFLRKGAFKWLDGFGDILGSIFSNEDDVELSIEDEAKYSRFRHSFEAALILKEGLDKSDTLIKSEVQRVFTEIDKVFGKDYATGEKIADHSKNKRWTRFFTRFEKLTGIGLLVKAREADQDNNARAKGEDLAKKNNWKKFGGDGDSDSS